MISQFIGFLFFISIIISGFWYIIIFINIVPYWIFMGIIEIYGKSHKEIDTELIRKKKLFEKTIVKVFYFP